MNEQMMEAALHSLSMHMPRAPSARVENMVKTVTLLAKKRAERTGQTPEPLSNAKVRSSPVREKDNSKTL
jgi:hypothetical protein